MVAVESRVELKYRPLLSGAVCCDSSGRIFVAEGWLGKTIHMYSMEGNHLHQIDCPECDWIESIACHEQAGEDITLVMRTFDRKTKYRYSLLRVSLCFPSRT
jgi:sugar lactone lactonase YvrE